MVLKTSERKELGGKTDIEIASDAMREIMEELGYWKKWRKQ